MALISFVLHRRKIEIYSGKSKVCNSIELRVFQRNHFYRKTFPHLAVGWVQRQTDFHSDVDAFGLRADIKGNNVNDFMCQPADISIFCAVARSHPPPLFPSQVRNILCAVIGVDGFAQSS